MYYRQENGTMILFEPSPKEYLERSRFEQPDRTSQPAWTHPVTDSHRKGENAVRYATLFPPSRRSFISGCRN